MFTFIVWTSCVVLSADPAASRTIVSGESWKATGDAAEGWEKPDFDAKGWRDAENIAGPAVGGDNFGVEVMFGFPSKAQWIWTGTGQFAYFRMAFDAPKTIDRAELIHMADDFSDVYLNGELIARFSTDKNPWGWRGGAEVVGLVPYLLSGKNTLAVKVKNNNASGPMGFAAELRINGEPFVPPLEIKTPPLPEEVGNEIDAWRPKIDDDDFNVREQASKKLTELVEKSSGKHRAALRGRLQALLAKSPSVEAKKRLEALLTLVPEPVETQLDPPEGKDVRHGFGRLDRDGLRNIWKSPADRYVVVVRHLMAARALAVASKDDFAKLVGEVLKDGTEIEKERVIAYVSLLECRSQLDVLRKTLEDEPKTKAGALAASALGRLGDKGDRTLLEKASKCGYTPTERAAQRGLARWEK